MRSRIILVLLATFLVSCEGAEGEVCQIDDDCGSGLECCKPTSSQMTESSLADRGTCEETCMPIDSGDEDGDVIDASEDDAG